MENQFELPQQPTLKVDKETPKPNGKKIGICLYDINETEVGFEVLVPAFIDKKREYMVGTRKEIFATREEAEQAADRSRNTVKVSLEQASLEKTYSKYLFRIDETLDGKFRVVLPSAVDLKTGYYIGALYREFDTWNEAKNYFLQRKEDEEKLIQKPLFEIQTGKTEKIIFSEFSAFNPRVAPSEQPREIPASIQKYLMDKGRLDGNAPYGNASTYQRTIQEKGWERNLFFFISSYLKKEGNEISKKLGIEHLDALTPKQATELAVEIVINLTKFNENDEGEFLKPKKSKADQSTVQQFLQEGLNRRNDSSWEGSGVCRNIASSVKAVFEALKTNQTRFSQLRDTYCLFEGGTEGFNPERRKKNQDIIGSGHAWNTFVTISKEGVANTSIIDVTWAKKNLGTKQIENLDYTLTRMEPLVFEVGTNLQESAPDKQEQIKRLLSYYLLKIEGVSQRPVEIEPVNKLNTEEKVFFRDVAIKTLSEKYDLSNIGGDQLVELGQQIFAERTKVQNQKKESQFFTTRAVELMRRQGVSDELPNALVEVISREYQKIAGKEIDVREIETIYKISQRNPNVNFQRIFKEYLRDKPLSNYHRASVIFRDDNLQRAAFEELKFRKDFEKFMKESPMFRSRMREVVPQLFTEFSPATKPEDAAELRYLIPDYYKHLIPDKPSEEQIGRLFVKVREELRLKNPEKYNQIAGQLDDYQVIKQYNKLSRELEM